MILLLTASSRRRRVSSGTETLQCCHNLVGRPCWLAGNTSRPRDPVGLASGPDKRVLLTVEVPEQS